MVKSNAVFTKDGDQVTVGITGFEDIMGKELPIVLVLPQAQPNWGTGPKTVKIVDLLKITQRYILDGNLINDSAAGDTSTTPEDKLDDLKDMFKAGGVVTLTYKGVAHTVQLDGSLSAKEVLAGGIDPVDGEVGYELKFTLLEGEDL